MFALLSLFGAAVATSYAATEMIPNARRYSIAQRYIFAPPSPKYTHSSPGIETMSDEDGNVITYLDVTTAATNETTVGVEELVFFFHGNATNIDESESFLFHLAKQLSPHKKAHVIAIEYQGYSPDTFGRTISEREIVKQCTYAVQQLMQKYCPSKLVFIGQSIGSGVALSVINALPESMKPAQLVLISAFTGIRDIVSENTHKSLSSLISERFPNMENILEYTGKVLFFHGISDELISYHHSEQLAELCQENPIVEIIAGGHNDLNRQFILLRTAKFILTNL